MLHLPDKDISSNFVVNKEFSEIHKLAFELNILTTKNYILPKFFSTALVMVLKYLTNSEYG